MSQLHDLKEALVGATIAFDLDGTLVDTAPDLVGALNAILAQESLPPLPFDEVRLMVGRGARALLERGFAAAGAPLDAERAPPLVERFIAHYLTRIAQESDGAVLTAAEPQEIAQQFADHLARSRPLRVERTTAWDRWWVLAGVLLLWGCCWGLRRSGGLV